MREVLFRGKKVFNGTIGSDSFVESDNFRCENGRWFIGGCRVADETVGQFTGLTDKNGVRVFESDIILSPQNDLHSGIVYFENGSFGVDVSYNLTFVSFNYFGDEVKEIEVIGNIHDNPELLGEVK